MKELVIKPGKSVVTWVLRLCLGPDNDSVLIIFLDIPRLPGHWAGWVWWPSGNLTKHGELPGQVQGHRDHGEPGVWGPDEMRHMGGFGGDNIVPRLKVDHLGELAKCDVVLWVILQFRSPKKLECVKYEELRFKCHCFALPLNWSR